jgi:ribosomal protein L40E
LVHLICLRCNHPNSSDARFCSQCGAGLLRKFCSQCHAINDAEAHFCQACGVTLSAHSSLPAVPAAAPPADVPALTDVVGADEALVPMESVAAVPEDLAPAPAPAPTLAADVPPVPQTQRAAWATRTPVLVGFGAAAVLLMAAALWSRPPQANPRSADPPVVSVAPTAPAPAAPTAVTPPAPAAAMQTMPPAALDAARGPTPDAMAPVPREAAKPGVRGTEAEGARGAQPHAANPPRGPAAEPQRAAVARPAPARPAPAPECTPQVDALGLCAPGAKVIGR